MGDKLCPGTDQLLHLVSELQEGEKKGKGHLEIGMTRTGFVDVGRVKNPRLKSWRGGVIYHPLLFYPGVSRVESSPQMGAEAVLTVLLCPPPVLTPLVSCPWQS